MTTNLIVSKQDILEALFSIVAENFSTDLSRLTIETSARDVNGWDSVSHVGLILNLETKFEIEFDILEVLKLSNLGELSNLIYEMKIGS